MIDPCPSLHSAASRRCTEILSAIAASIGCLDGPMVVRVAARRPAGARGCQPST